MKTFAQLRTKNLQETSEPILESLNSAVDFYMTDDTKIPQEIYGAYKIDGTDYGMSLTQTNINKIYELRFYRVVNTKARRWSFMKPTHIRPGLATLLKFCEASLPFLTGKIDGIIIPIAGKIDPQKFNNLVRLTIQKTYMSTFKFVPVIATTDKKMSYNYIFFTRKAVSPQTVFSSKSFSKFTLAIPPEEVKYVKDEVKKGNVPAEVLDTVKPKKKVAKAKVSLKKSPKYDFKGLSASMVTDGDAETPPEAVDEISKLSHITYKIDPDNAKGAIPTTTNKVKKAEPKKVKVLPPKPKEPPAPKLKTIKLDDNLIPISMLNVMTSAKTMIEKHGFDESKFNWDNFKYAFNQAYAGAKSMVDSDPYTPPNAVVMFVQGLIPTLQDKGLVDGMGHIIDIPSIKNDFKNYLKNYAEMIKKNQLEKIKNSDKAKKAIADAVHNKSVMADHAEEMQVYKKKKFAYDKLVNPPEPSETYGKPAETYIHPKVDFIKLQSQLSGSGEITHGSRMMSCVEKGENIGVKQEELQKTHGYNNLLSAGLKYTQKHTVKQYTGADYDEYNNPLRNIIYQGLMDNNLDEKTMDYESYKKILNLGKAFDQIKPLPIDMWVYRGGKIPVLNQNDIKTLMPGNDFFEAAFMSTSIKSQNTFGMSNLKLRIFVPKGSKVIPALGDNSKHSSEMEVILPPCSVHKIIRLDKFVNYGDTSYMLTTVFMGSAFNSAMNKITPVDSSGKKVEVKKLEEAKKQENDKKYDADKKFGSKVSIKDQRAAQKALKSGNLKVKK